MQRTGRPSARPRANGRVRLFWLDGAGAAVDVDVGAAVCVAPGMELVFVVVAVVIKCAAVGGREASPEVGTGSELSTLPAVPDVTMNSIKPPIEEGRKAV